MGRYHSTSPKTRGSESMLFKNFFFILYLPAYHLVRSYPNARKGIVKLTARVEIGEIKRDALEQCPPPDLTAKNMEPTNTTLEDLWNFGNPDPEVFYHFEDDIDAINILPGGYFKPKNCKPINKVAVLIPFRGSNIELTGPIDPKQPDRLKQLKFNIPNMHKFMRKQNLEFKIYVIEQSWTTKFNRAKLLNIGFQRASEEHAFDCFIIHDVDRVPVNPKVPYHCHRRPFHYTDDGVFGGIAQIRKDTIMAINGFSNLFFGWGGEDTEIARRLAYATRFVRSLGYAFNPFVRERSVDNYLDAWINLHTNRKVKDAGNEKNPHWKTMAQNLSMTYDIDGLSRLTYDLLDITEHNFYTNFLVDFDMETAEGLPMIDHDSMILAHPCMSSKKANDECMRDKKYI